MTVLNVIKALAFLMRLVLLSNIMTKNKYFTIIYDNTQSNFNMN